MNRWNDEATQGSEKVWFDIKDAPGFEVRYDLSADGPPVPQVRRKGEELLPKNAQDEPILPKLNR